MAPIIKTLKFPKDAFVPSFSLMHSVFKALNGTKVIVEPYSYWANDTSCQNVLLDNGKVITNVPVSCLANFTEPNKDTSTKEEVNDRYFIVCYTYGEGFLGTGIVAVRSAKFINRKDITESLERNATITNIIEVSKEDFDEFWR